MLFLCAAYQLLCYNLGTCRFEEDDEDDSDGEGRDSFVENVEFEPPRVQELIDPSLSNWVRF